MDIVTLYEHRGLTPDEIVSLYPSIDLADVHAALAYYFDHREEAEGDLAADLELAAEVAAATPWTWKRKLT